MSSIDERIVEMRFKNGQFERGISQTNKSLKEFNKSLNLQGATKGLDEVSKAAKNLKFDGLADDVGKINSKISLFGVAAATVMSSLTNSAIGFGKKLVGNVLDPIVAGGRRRAENIEQAKFMLDGLKVAWDDILPSINYAVEGTAYGLDEAARAASSLVASQVPLENMGTALRGISGVAAMTNSSYSDMAQIFTTVAGNGRLMASELNRIGGRGINAAAALAEFLNVTEKEVRDMTSKGKIDFETFAAAMDHAFGDQATKANETYSGSLANVRAALARIGAEPAAAKMEKMRVIFNALRPKINDVKNALQPLIDLYGQMAAGSARRWSGFLEGIDVTKYNKGFKNLADAFKNVWMSVNLFSTRMSRAIKAAFPKSTGEWFTNVTNGIKNFTRLLIPSVKTLNRFESVMTIIFSVISNLFGVVKALTGVFKPLIGVIFQIIGLIWDLIAPFFNLETGISLSTDSITGFIDSLRVLIEGALVPVIKWLSDFRDKLKDVREGGTSGNKTFDKIYKTIKKFSEFASGKFWEWIDNFKNAITGLVTDNSLISRIGGFFKSFDLSNIDLSGVKTVGEVIKDVFGNIGTFLVEAWNVINQVAPKIGSTLGDIGKAIGKFLDGITMGDVLAAAQTGGIIAVLIAAYKHMKAVNRFIDSLSGVAYSVSGVLDTFAGNLAQVQKNMKVNNFLKIAAAIAVLAGALWVISTIPQDKLLTAGIALGLIAAGVMLMMAAMEKMTATMKPKQASDMLFMAIAMTVVSGAILLLANAVKKLADLEWEQLAKGVGSVVGLLLGLGIATRIMSSGNQLMISTAIAIGIFASSLWILASAVKKFGDMDIETLKKGGITVALALGAMTAAATIISLPKNNANLAKAATGILVMVGSLYLLAMVMEHFAGLDFEIIKKGGGIAAISLLALSGALIAISRLAPNAMSSALSIAVLAGSLAVIAGAFYILSGIDTGKLITSAIAISLVVGILSIIAFQLQGIDGLMGAVSVALLAASLVLIAVAINQVADIDTGKLYGIVGALAILVGVIGLVGALIGNVPQVALAIGLLAAALAAIAGILFGVGFIFQSIANLIEMAISAFDYLVSNAPNISNALLVLAEGAEAIAPYAGDMAKAGAGLIILGLGAAAAAIGVGLLGIALIALGVGLGIITVVGPIGAVALQSLVDKIMTLNDKKGDIALIGGALLALGVGMIAAGVGAIIAGVAMAVMSGALDKLAPSLLRAIPAFDRLSDSAKRNKAAVGPLLGLGAGLLVFGAGAMIAGMGAKKLGDGLMKMGTGLILIAGVGQAGANALVNVVETLAPLWKEAAKLTIVSAELLALGTAIGIMGASMGLAAASLIGFTMGMTMFQAVVPVFVANIRMLVATLRPVSSQIKSSLKTIGTSISQSSSEITSSIVSLAAAVSGSLGSISAAFLGLGIAMANSMGQGITSGMNSVRALILMSILAIIVSTAARIVGSAGMFTTSGRLLGVAFALGLASSVGTVVTSGRTITTLLNATLRLGNISARLSGRYVMTGFIAGINAARGSVVTAGRSASSALSSGLRSGLSTASAVGRSGGYSVGLAIAQGASSGVNAGTWGVVASVRSMAQRAVAAAKAELDVRSPSRVFRWIFDMVTEGSVRALDDGAKDVSKASANMGSSAISSMKKSVSDMDRLFDMDIDMSPTIRPVLDLTGVEKSASNIGDIIGKNSVNANLSAAMADSYSKTTTKSKHDAGVDSESASGSSYVFNQYNSSPKALSTIDIYRNTNNLVSKAKKVGEPGA